MPSLHRLRAFWRTTSPLDRLAAAIIIFTILAWTTPLGRLLSFLSGWLFLIFLIAAGYLIVRFARWTRKRLLWGLRNRLIIAYVFIAVVPVVLLATIVGISAYLLYFQLGAHLLSDDLHERVDSTAHVADTLARTLAAHQNSGASVTPANLFSQPGIAALLDGARQHLPGLEIHIASANELGAKARALMQFSGLVQSGGTLWIESAVPANVDASAPPPRANLHSRSASPPNHAAVTSAQQNPNLPGELFVRVPVTAALLASLAPDLGP